MICFQLSRTVLKPNNWACPPQNTFTTTSCWKLLVRWVYSVVAHPGRMRTRPGRASEEACSMWLRVLLSVAPANPPDSLVSGSTHGRSMYIPCAFQLFSLFVDRALVLLLWLDALPCHLYLAGFISSPGHPHFSRNCFERRDRPRWSCLREENATWSCYSGPWGPDQGWSPHRKRTGS